MPPKVNPSIETIAEATNQTPEAVQEKFKAVSPSLLKLYAETIQEDKLSKDERDAVKTAVEAVASDKPVPPEVRPALAKVREQREKMLSTYGRGIVDMARHERRVERELTGKENKGPIGRTMYILGTPFRVAGHTAERILNVAFVRTPDAVTTTSSKVLRAGEKGVEGASWFTRKVLVPAAVVTGLVAAGFYSGQYFNDTNTFSTTA